MTGSHVVRDGAPAARCGGRWLVLARAGWVVVAIVVLAVFVASIPTYLAQRQAVCTGRACAQLLLTPETVQALRRAGLSAHTFAVLTTALAIGFALVWVAVAALIVWRRADGWFPLFVALMLVTMGTTLNAEQIPAYSAWRWPILSIQFIGSSFLVAFFYLFPDGRFVPRWTRWLALVLVAMLVPFFVLPALAVTRGESPVGFLVAVAVLTTAAGAQLYRYRRVSGPAQRQQAKWLVFGLAALVCGLLGEGGLALLFPARVHPGSPAWLITSTLLNVLILLVPLSIGVAILRYRLWDIDVLINRTLVYSALTASLALVYLGSVVLLQGLLRALTGQRSDLAVVAATLLVAVLFHPLRQRLQAGIDRRFYRRKYDAARTLAAFSAVARDEVDLTTLTADIVAVVDQTLQPAQVCLWLPPGGADGPLPGTSPAFEIAPTDPLLAHVRGAVGPVDLATVQLPSPGLQALHAAGVTLVVPLVSRGELLGLLSLGPRRSGQDFASDDRALLATLATQATPAVRVAQLVRQQQAELLGRERVEQELRVARQIQHTLLPKERPTLPGWKVATHYQPAWEVGGDFYDFLALPGGRLGLIIGDVSDKGVPAALVMATTRSILRGAAQQMAAPGAVLARANELLYPDTPPAMFVTCLYAILDPASGQLRYANAGHDLPYLRHGEGVSELRACGMPLGLLPGMRYEEQTATIAPAEMVLLYSDGLVEAHNAQREMFGFPRLRDLVAAHAPSDGAGLIALLLADLQQFTGAAWEQEDDITLVALRRCVAPASSAS